MSIPESLESVDGAVTQSSLSALWSVRPLPDQFLASAAIISGRLLTIITLAAYLFAAPRNWGSHNGFVLFQCVVILTLALMSSRRVQLSGAQRLSALSFMIVIIAVAAYLRNQEILAALFSTLAFTPFLIVTYGMRVALSMTTLLHAIFLFVAFYMGEQDIPTVLVYLSISYLWTLVGAVFVGVMLGLIGNDLVRINDLLAQQSQLMNVISHELRVPSMALSVLTKRETFTAGDLVNMRDAADQLVLVIDNLRSSANTHDLRPLRKDNVRLNNFIMQLGTQFKPVIADLGFELYADVIDRDNRLLSVDRFRLRAVISHILRNAAYHSDGDKIWLNARIDASDSSDLMSCVIEIEDNGSTISAQSGRDLLASTGSSTSQGLGLAISWLDDLEGVINYYPSPRGGAGFRIMFDLTFDVSGSNNLDTDELLSPWHGMRVLLIARNEALRLMIVRELNWSGLFVDEADSLSAATEMLSQSTYDMRIYGDDFPDQDVAEWLGFVRQTENQMPTIIVSSTTNIDVKSQLVNTGSTVVMNKLMDASDLGAALQSLVTLGALKRRV